ncbi:MAG TPA: hypothetical protein VJQ79_10270, partial [Acidimicrobiia bacterium]|nr:hypothetical protein [Acidimicrobiia bacterium]
MNSPRLAGSGTPGIPFGAFTGAGPALARVVFCAGGVWVAQRDAGPTLPAGTGLRVGPVAPVLVPGSEPVVSQRSDEVVWRRHWSETDRLVIEFVDLVTVAVQDSKGLVTFDRYLEPEMEQHLLFDHILPLVLARRGNLVLHGGVISRNGTGVVLVGATGAGKSTMTAFAWQHGWTVGGDDGAVLHATDPPTVEPTYATVRLTPDSAALLGVDPAMSEGVIGKIRIAGAGVQAFTQEAVELRVIAIIDPVEARAEARLDRLDSISAHARLFGATFHADLAADRSLPGVLDRLATIVETSI